MGNKTDVNNASFAYGINLLRMLRDYKKGLIERIIVKFMSHFSRNTEKMMTVL